MSRSSAGWATRRSWATGDDGPGRDRGDLRDGIEYDELAAIGDADLRTEAGAAAEIVLDRSPFYAEGGGQVGDRGVLRAADGAVVFEVEDTQRPSAGLVVQRGVLRGRVRAGDTLTAEVDATRRARTMRNHTGTHLLRRARRNVVGERARQAGSLVTPDALRFDFPLDRGLTSDERRAIEDEVRRIVREDRTVIPSLMTMREAIEAGADAFFDEKYGETVRTVRVDGFSHELCGGTHCRARPDRRVRHRRRAGIGSGMRRMGSHGGQRGRLHRGPAGARAGGGGRGPDLDREPRTGSPRSRRSSARRDDG